MIYYFNFGSNEEHNTLKNSHAFTLDYLLAIIFKTDF